ncbi:MAG: SAM-dependent methyltransferase [Propionibacteriales bacterium]|nr:SAM-dependent methyltransferase [Propionibacteriales bacterium]
MYALSGTRSSRVPVGSVELRPVVAVAPDSIHGDDEAVNPQTLYYLLSPPGGQLLREAQAAYDGDNALQVSTSLKTSYEPGQIAAALTQIRLRRRAVAKFGADATLMFLTRDGLEQATHSVVAAHRAAKAARSGARTVLELGCGVGADLIAFCRAGLEVTAVDHDRLTARIAAANLEALQLGGQVSVGSAESQDRSWADLVYVDPARRSALGRVFAPQSYSPPWSFVVGVLTADAVVKAAPGLAHEHVPPGVEAEWVSLDGRLREAALWSGPAVSARRRATVLTSQGGSTTVTDADDPGSADVRRVGRFVYEPDDAVIRAHLVTAVASQMSGWLLEEHLAYVSADRLSPTPLTRAFEVIDVLPFKEKALRAALRARDIGPLTIKKRGVTVTPETLRKRLGLTGSTAATIIITRTPDAAAVLLVRPCQAAG